MNNSTRLIFRGSVVLLIVFGAAGILIDRVARSRGHPPSVITDTIVESDSVNAEDTLGANQPDDPVESLYEPTIDDFKRPYETDRSNQDKQTWDNYYGWVKAFYNGWGFTKGWSIRATDALSKINDRKACNEITRKLNELGRMVAEEWAKDNNSRRIGTDDLASFGQQLENAVAKDDGTGTKICEAITELQTVVGSKLEKKEDKKSAPAGNRKVEAQAEKD